MIVIILIASSFATGAQYQPPHEKPGPAADRIVFKAFAQEIAPASLDKGDMDLYLYTLKTAMAKELVGKPGISLYRAPASTTSIILNPAPAPSGELNPLSLREVRYALQYVVNREFVANEIYRGLAEPMLSHVSPFDLDYLTIYDLVREFNINYDPEYAKEMVIEALTEAGATLEEGLWHYNDRPITLKFIIRIEDERREIGELVAAELVKLGFTVNRIYHEFGPAILRVYSTDPKAFDWHLYTEGYGKGTVEKYDYATINQMYAPWFGNMPGWQEVGFWQYKNADLDEICQKIFKGEFRDLQERNDLYRQATEIGVMESVRIWVATVLNTFPAKDSLVGVTGDLASGPRSLWTLREAHVSGRSDLTVGHLWVWSPRTVWNPVGGFGDVYSVDVWRNVFDPPLWRHPFTGVPVPFRAHYEVETAGPTGKINVPPNAFVWNASVGEWLEVGQGVKATSKVTFNYRQYLSSKWHHDQSITMADAIYAIYQAFDMTYNPDKAAIEYAIATVGKPYLDTFRGFNLLNDTSLEVYIDYWHFEPEYIAEFASPTSFNMPWEMLLAMDTLVFEEKPPRAAYSDIAAGRLGVDQLSLVERKHTQLVKDTLTEFITEGHLPENVFTVGGTVLVGQEEAAERYGAALAWYNAHKEVDSTPFVISNGPFKLVAFDPTKQYAELEAFRDPTYPFKPGDWYFGTPSLPEIVEVESKKIVIGSDTSFTVSLQGPGKLSLTYLFVDPVKGETLLIGDAQQISANTFSVTLPSESTSELDTGQYQLVLAAYSDEVSYVAEREELVEAVVSLPTPTPTATPSYTPSPTSTPTPTPKPQADSTTWLAAGLIIAVVFVVALFFMRKRGKG